MKTFAMALVVFGLGIASAHAQAVVAEPNHEGQDYEAVPVQAAVTREVPAGMVLANEDLINDNLMASDLVTVTSIPSSGVIDTGQ